MEKRRQMLMIALGVAAALVVLVQFGPKIIAPFTAANRQLKAAQKRQAQLTAEVSKKSELQEAYRALAARTLSLNADAAGKELHSVLNDLAQTARIGRPIINKPIERTSRDRVTRSPLTVISVLVQGEGQIGDVVNFLDAFYRLPYMLYITELRLTPAQVKTGQVIKFEAKVETLVLQPNTVVGRRQVTTAPLEPHLRGKADRLAQKNASEYKQVAAKNIFAQQVPVVQAPPQPPPPTPVPANRFATAQPQKPDNRNKTILVGIARYPWYDGGTGGTTIYQEAITRNDLTNEKRVIRVGESLDVGTLVLVDSSGAVVRTGSREVYLYYLYPLGKPLTESTKLDPGTQPDLYKTVQELERQQ
jgi:hypothetical protein